MKKFNINWEPIGKFAKTVCEIAVYGALAVASVKFSESATKSYGNTTASYSDAVEAITFSSMLSSYKNDAVAMLNRNGTADYYKAVIRVAEDDSMLTSYKIDMIKTLSKE
jgi:hypothetical protein